MLCVDSLMFALQLQQVLLCVDHGRVWLGVAHERLDFINRHTAAEARRGKRVAELVRIDVELGAFCNFADDVSRAWARIGA